MYWYFSAGQPIAPMRHEIRRYFSNHALAGSLDAIEVIVGELLSNVVRHTNSGATIHVTWQAGTPILTVVDDGPGFDPDDIPYPSFDADYGYGLWLVENLAQDVRITRDPQGGTTVSVELPTD